MAHEEGEEEEAMLRLKDLQNSELVRVVQTRSNGLVWRGGIFLLQYSPLLLFPLNPTP